MVLSFICGLDSLDMDSDEWSTPVDVDITDVEPGWSADSRVRSRSEAAQTGRTVREQSPTQFFDL